MVSENIKPDRTDLQNEIIKTAKLPGASSTDGYFTRQQLIELHIHLVRQNQIIDKQISDINTLTITIRELRNAGKKSEA